MSDPPQTLLVAATFRGPNDEEIALNDTADMASEVASSANLDAVSRAANGEEVAQNNTAYMSSEAASGTNLDAASRGDKNEEVTLDQTTIMSSRTASRTNLEKRFKLTKLEPEIRSLIFGLSALEYIDLAAFDFPPGREPTFVSAISQQNDDQLRLEDIEALLLKAVLEVTTKEASANVLKWLASVDFMPLKGDKQAPIQNGFDAVRALGFSDVNRVETHRYAVDEFTNDGTRYTTEHSRQTNVAPSSWADDLEFTRKCKRLRTVEMKVALPSYFLERLRGGQPMEHVVQGHSDDRDELLPIHRLLKLKGLKVLHLTFFTPLWQATMLNVEQERVITCWLQEEFEKLGQSVVVGSEFDWWE